MCVEAKMKIERREAERLSVQCSLVLPTCELRVSWLEKLEKCDQLQVTLQAILAASQMTDAEGSAAEEVRRVEKAEAERLILEKAETAPEPEPETRTENEAEEEPEPEQ